VVAFGAPVELGGGFVSTSSLEEPPRRLVMSTLRTIDFGGWERVQLRFLVSDDLDLRGVGELLFGRLSHRLSRGLAGVTAVVADVGYGYLSGALDLLELESRSTLGAEL
jgi:hypothetical protein